MAEERRQTNQFVLHENGSQIPLSPEFVGDGSVHRHWRRVKGDDGEWYDHVGEDDLGRWTYRHTDHNINDYPIAQFGPHHARG